MSTEFKCGELLVIETGEYSDRSWHGPFKVLTNFDMVWAAEQIKAEWQKNPQEGRYTNDPAPFDLLEWLAKKAFIEDVDHRTIHIGSYGDIQIER